MRRKWISTLLMLTIGVGLLSGCGKAADNNTTTEVTDATSNGEDGTVTLRVWSEESNFDLMNQMIESFKQEYSGQATFDITLEESSDSEAKNNVLKDIHSMFKVNRDNYRKLISGYTDICKGQMTRRTVFSNGFVYETPIDHVLIKNSSEFTKKY